MQAYRRGCAPPERTQLKTFTQCLDAEDLLRVVGNFLTLKYLPPEDTGGISIV